MKNLFKFFVLSLVVSLVSCHSSKKTEEQPEEDVNAFVEGLTAEDTIQVIKLTTDYLDLLKNNQVDEALDMLCELKNDTIYPLSDETREQLRSTINMFPVLSYNIDVLFLRNELDNEIRFTTEFFEKPEGDNRPNTTKGVLYPCKVDGRWILSMVQRGYNEEAEKLKKEMEDEAE
jgi:hypothetical protein